MPLAPLARLGRERAMSLRTVVFAVSAMLLAVGPARAQPGEPLPQLPPLALSTSSTDVEIAVRLDAWLSDLNRDGAFSGAVLVARDGREIFASARGETGVGTNVALTADTRFPLASIGKVFTHVAIAQLIQQGRLEASDTIADLLPDYPNAVSHGATVEQLLNHRAGIADIFGPAFRDFPKDQLTSNSDYYRFVAAQPPMFAPGEGEEYCNGCYIVLGEIIARVSGQSYESYLAQNVFAAAGMSNTGFLRHDRLPADAARFTGRPMGPQGELMDVSRFHGVAGSAAGNVYSTLRDMLAFDSALREHRLINPELTAQVLRGAPAAGRSAVRAGYAGGAPGVNTMLMGNGAWTMVVLTNRPPPTAEAIGQTVFPLLAGPRSQ